MNPIAIRLLSQQLISPQFRKPEEVVAHMGAMQAQDYRMVRWAVAMRTKCSSNSSKSSIKAFREAFDGGKIIRMHLLRGTWQLITAEDYGWMLELFAPKAKATLNGWMRANKILIDEKEELAIREILIEKAMECESLTKKDFDCALQEHGITMDDHRLRYHLMLAEYSKTLCSGNLTAKEASYALVEKKIRNISATMERDEMLMLLAKKYFQSHAPATFEDYVWWSGLSAADCRKGMQLLGNELRKESWKGYDFYLLDSCRTRGFRKGTVLLLPPYDEYLIGYKTRELVLASHHVPHAHTNNGIFFPVIAKDGIICGNWSPWKKTLQTECFDSVSDSEDLKDSEKEDLGLWKQWERFSEIKEIDKE